VTACEPYVEAVALQDAEELPAACAPPLTLHRRASCPRA
jgi:hypothetical protein